jgi:hypothetical protein
MASLVILGPIETNLTNPNNFPIIDEHGPGEGGGERRDIGEGEHRTPRKISKYLSIKMQ